MIRIALISLFVVAGISFTDSKNLVTENKKNTANASTRGRLTSLNFEDSVRSLYTSIGLEQKGLRYEVFRYGMIGFYSLRQEGKVKNDKMISLIDFSKPSTEKRFYTIDLANKKVAFHSLVSHGRNTGENLATKFSDTPHSNQSSLGFYVTNETYVGSKGYSLRLDGMDPGYNGNIRSRAVVMHEADYVSEAWIKKYGRLGRSQGCPALPKDISRKVIDTIKNGTLIFAYYNDEKYIKTSSHLNLPNLFAQLEKLQ